MLRRLEVGSVGLAFLLVATSLYAQTPGQSELPAPALAPPTNDGDKLPAASEKPAGRNVDSPANPAAPGAESQELIPPIVRPSITTEAPSSDPPPLPASEQGTAEILPPIVSPETAGGPPGTYRNGVGAWPGIDLAGAASDSYFYAGAEVLWARPFFNASLDSLMLPFFASGAGIPHLDYDYTASPRVWIGTQTADGGGLECSYWQFDANGRGSVVTMDGGTVGIADPGVSDLGFPDPAIGANPRPIDLQVPSLQFSTSDSLTVQALYLHATQQWNLGALSLRGGAGVRYASYEQYFATVQAETAQTETAEIATAAQTVYQAWRDFHGIGPSALLEARRQIGVSRVWGFARAGGAVLCGNRSYTQAFWAEVIPVGAGEPSPAAAVSQTTTSEDTLLSVGELAIGLEWTGRLANGDVLAARGSFEGQRWTTGNGTYFDLAGFAGFAAGLEWRH